MNISKTKRNFIGLNTLFAILSAGVGAVILHVALPGHYFGGYPFIPTYFYLFGLFSIYMFDACRQHAPHKDQRKPRCLQGLQGLRYRNAESHESR